MFRWPSYHACVRARTLSTVCSVYDGVGCVWRRQSAPPISRTLARARFSSSTPNAPAAKAPGAHAGNAKHAKAEMPMTFAELGVSSILVDALKLSGFSEPNYIQKRALPHLLKEEYLSAIERLSNDPETNEEELDDASTLEQKKAASTPEEQKQEASPAEEQKQQASPTEEQKQQASPTEEQKQQASPTEEQKQQASPTEEQKKEAGPTEKQKEANPAEEQKEDVQKANVEPDCVVAAETGSGKTLVYTIAAIERLCRVASGVDAQVLITSPSHELCSQIHRCISSLLSHIEWECDISCTILLPSSFKDEFRPAEVPRTRRSIIIGIPSMLDLQWKRSVNRRPITGEAIGKQARVIQVIIDEADIIFESNDTRTQSLKRCLLAPEVKGAPLLLVGASFSTRGLRSTTKRLDGLLSPDAVWIRSPTLHHIPARIRQNFQSVSDAIETKARAILAALRADATTDKQRVLVFCNSADNAMKLCNRLNFILTREELDRSDPKEHDRIINQEPEFGILSKSVPVDERLKTLARFESGACLRLVCTDLVSRGLDFGGHHIAHVIEADLALNAIDHLHRLGRTARAGRSGRATSLVSGAAANELAARLQVLASKDKNKSIEELFSRKRMLRKKLKKLIRAQCLEADDAAGAQLATAPRAPT